MPTTHPLLVPKLRNSEAIPPLTLWVLLGLLRVSLYPLPLLLTTDSSVEMLISEEPVGLWSHVYAHLLILAALFLWNFSPNYPNAGLV